MEIKISVIIPTYNRLEFLPIAIDSVLSQTYPPYEIIIVDDGSTDGTKDFIKYVYGNSLKYIYQKNQGVSSARNTGIYVSKGDFIAFLDSDDWWNKNKLEEQVKCLLSNPYYEVCYTNEAWFMNGKRKNQHKKHQKYGGEIFQYTLPLCIISPSSILLKKSIFYDIGVFDETLPVCEDYDLWIRIADKYEILFIDKLLINKRGGHEDQLSHSLPIMDYYRIIALYKFLMNKMQLDEHYKLAKQMIEYKIKIVYNGAIKHNNIELKGKLDFIIDSLVLSVNR